MSVLVLLILLSLLFSGGALILYLRASKSGQFDSLSAGREMQNHEGTGQGAHLPFDEEIVQTQAPVK